MGLGEAIQNVKLLDSAVEELATIAGQKPASWTMLTSTVPGSPSGPGGPSAPAG